MKGIKTKYYRIIFVVSLILLLWSGYLYRFIKEGNIVGIVFVLVLSVIYGFVWYTLDKRNRDFRKVLRDMVEEYNLTPKDLGVITNFSQYDFTKDSKGNIDFVFMNNRKKRQQVLTALQDYKEERS